MLLFVRPLDALEVYPIREFVSFLIRLGGIESGMQQLIQTRSSV